jgi:glutaconate CoA-transferase subunit B
VYTSFQADKQHHPADVMVCAIARMLKNGERIFHGVSSQLPMVAMKLSKALYAPEAVLLNIPGGVNPNSYRTSEYSSAGEELWENSDANFPLEKIFDLSMRGGLDVAFLSGVQFDVKGNVNASVIGDYKKPKVRLPGGAGSAVLIPTAKKAIIWRTKHDPRTFVENVDFITTRGNLYKIVTPLCIFGYSNERLYLEAISPYTTIEEVKAKTGFKIMENNVPTIEEPTKEELSALRRIDPKGVRYKEFSM